MKSYNGEQLVSTTLANGLQVHTQKTPTGTVTLSITTKAGSFNEDKHFGIAHLIEHMVFKGTKKRTVDQINEEIESVGGIMNAETSFDYTRFHVTVPSDAWQTGLDIICDLVFNPTIPQEELEREKAVVQEEIDMYNDMPDEFAQEELFRGMNKDYPNRQSVAGTRESVGAIQRPDILEFMDRYYKPDNMFVVAVGDINHDDVVNFLQTNYPVEGRANIPITKRFVRGSLDSDVISNTRHINQAHLTWGLFAPPANGEDSVATDIACTILGGSTTSRLYKIIREQLGLAYTVNVGYMTLVDAGVIVGYAGLNASKINEVRDIVVEQFELLRTTPVTDAELQRAKNYTQGTFLIRMERTSAVNSFIVASLLRGVAADPNDYLKKIEAVTADDIVKVAKTYFTPDNWLFSQVVPAGTKDEQ